MAKFRSHRGSLAESMETVTEVNNLEDIKKHLLKLGWDEMEKKNLTCKYYCEDDRIGWHTYIILADGSAIGFSNEKLK